MKRLNKKTIIYIIIIICITVGYYLYTKKEQNVENYNELLNFEENIQSQENVEKQKLDEKEKIIIYITGAVKNEGIYELEEGSRIADSIEIAGGLTQEAQIENMNLAYVLTDGIKIHIPTKSENINEVQDDTNLYITKENTNTEDTKNTSKKININNATQTELETLPGIGPSIALKIIDYRKENGKFIKIEDIKNVSGIGENKYLKIKDLIKV